MHIRSLIYQVHVSRRPSAGAGRDGAELRKGGKRLVRVIILVSFHAHLVLQDLLAHCDAENLVRKAAKSKVIKSQAIRFLFCRMYQVVTPKNPAKSQMNETSTFCRAVGPSSIVRL